MVACPASVGFPESWVYPEYGVGRICLKGGGTIKSLTGIGIEKSLPGSLPELVI